MMMLTCQTSESVRETGRGVSMIDQPADLFSWSMPYLIGWFPGDSVM